MFCFGWGAPVERQQTQSAGTMHVTKQRPPSPVSTCPAASIANGEDVISDISSDGKYEIDIPKEFSLANLENIRFIDSDKQDSDSTEDCASQSEALSDPDRCRFIWGLAPDCPPISLNNERGSASNSRCASEAASPRIIDNLIGERSSGGFPSSTADLADRLGSLSSSNDLSSRHSSVESAASTADIANLAIDVSPCRGRSPAPGPRFKLIVEGDIYVCHLNHTRTVISKILSSKFLRRWESHHLYLDDVAITSKSLVGFLEAPLAYSSMEEVYSISRWDVKHKYCLRIVVPDGSLLLQAKNAYTRDQWFHSIQWKRNIYKFRHIFSQCRVRDVILKELKSMVEYVMSTPLQDESITSEPLEIISKLLAEEHIWSGENTPGRTSAGETALGVAGPLIASASLPPQLCAALGRHCRAHPRSPRLRDTLAHVARRILKHNVDFGKSPHLRRFIQDYISALNRQNGGADVVRAWVGAVHGAGSVCPHPRVLPNLAASCLAALHVPPPPTHLEIPRAEKSKSQSLSPVNNNNNNADTPFLLLSSDDVFPMDGFKSDTSSLGDKHSSCPPTPFTVEVVDLKAVPAMLLNKMDTSWTDDDDLVCFANVIRHMSEYVDWAEGLGALLQPVPVPSRALQHKKAGAALAAAAGALGRDPRCAVHRTVLPLRHPRPGWFHLLSPTEPGAPDEHVQLWGDMLETLLSCCCKRKKFLIELAEMLPACLLLAIRAHPAGLESLCLMLEWEVLEEEQARVEAAQALRSTPTGRRALKASCQRQVHLKKLQQKGGPRRLTLPSRATDADVARLLSAGSFGNLECLSLAFTHVTSAVAEQLIKLPSLRYLNLWATQFGDAGVLLIAEHLQRLQVLNLCETPVSDTGIAALAALSGLRKLNLNSTKLTAATWTRLRSRLPALQESDVRYTDAW